MKSHSPLPCFSFVYPRSEPHSSPAARRSLSVLVAGRPTNAGGCCFPTVTTTTRVSVLLLFLLGGKPLCFSSFMFCRHAAVGCRPTSPPLSAAAPPCQRRIATALPIFYKLAQVSLEGENPNSSPFDFWCFYD